MTVEWELLAKRLLAANQLGLRIHQCNGHRYIEWDTADTFSPPPFDGLKSKQYGSYVSALDHIDEVLAQLGRLSLTQVFNGINYQGDLSNIFGEGVQ